MYIRKEEEEKESKERKNCTGIKHSGQKSMSPVALSKVGDKQQNNWYRNKPLTNLGI